MVSAIYPGSFDPMTRGHIDVIEKSLNIFDTVYIVITINPDKQHMLSIEDRTEIVKLSLSSLNIPENKNIIIIPYKGIISNLAIELNVNAMIRGIRNQIDMQNEYAIEQFTEISTNKKIITIYFSPDPIDIYTSSTLVRNIIKGGFTEKAEKYMDKKAFNYLKTKIEIKPIIEDKEYKLIRI